LEEMTPLELGGLQENVPQEVSVLEGQEAEEPDDDLPECQDHQLSFFLKGKPRSIYSLWFANIYFASFYV
jgi:hypothetical protein